MMNDSENSICASKSLMFCVPPLTDSHYIFRHIEIADVW